VDVVPHKVCPYDCLYCQVGATTDLAVERRSFIDPDQVAHQVEQALSRRPDAEVVTLSGSGEPTLYRELGELASGLRQVTRLPLALLTNSALLWQDDVLRAALSFDLVAPSLDAADPDTFALINCPHPEITFERMLQGLRTFCRAFRGSCRLEIMLLRGVNDSPTSLDALARLASSLEVTTVDLNTVTRPPARPAQPLGRESLEQALAHFASCRAEIIAPYRAAASARPSDATSARQRILETLARRPCTVDDLCHALHLDRAEVLAACAAALEEGEIREQGVADERYYRLAAV
jgi:wyosine [tRNA(Phe)-imidazoG37] synthetase (radical SAM superfamily)